MGCFTILVCCRDCEPITNTMFEIHTHTHNFSVPSVWTCAFPRNQVCLFVFLPRHLFSEFLRKPHAWEVASANTPFGSSSFAADFFLFKTSSRDVPGTWRDWHFSEPQSFKFWIHFQEWTTVDGSEIRQTHQLRLVVYPHYLQGFLHPRWLIGTSEPSTVAFHGVHDLHDRRSLATAMLGNARIPSFF